MTCFVELSDEALIEAYRAKAEDMSYFNAAGGQSWYQEAAARNKCQAELKMIFSELINRNLPIPVGSWLI